MTQETINTILNAVLVPLLPVLTAYLVSLLKKKAKEIESRTANATVKSHIENLENIIETSVNAVSQIMVNAAKKNGTFNAAAAAEAKETAKQYVLSTLAPSVKSELSNVFGDLEGYVCNRIEHYVAQSKTCCTSAAATDIAAYSTDSTSAA